MYMYIQSTIHLYKRALCNFSLPSVLSYAHACVVTVRNRHVCTYVTLRMSVCSRMCAACIYVWNTNTVRYTVITTVHRTRFRGPEVAGIGRKLRRGIL